jgi:hypothetical protein
MATHIVESTRETVRSGYLDPAAQPVAVIESGDTFSYPNIWTHWGNEAVFGMSFAEREPDDDPMRRPDADAVAKRAEHWESNASLRSRFLVDKISSMFIALTWTASALLRMAEEQPFAPLGVVRDLVNCRGVKNCARNRGQRRLLSLLILTPGGRGGVLGLRATGLPLGCDGLWRRRRGCRRGRCLSRWGW